MLGNNIKNSQIKNQEIIDKVGCDKLSFVDTLAPNNLTFSFMLYDFLIPIIYRKIAYQNRTLNYVFGLASNITRIELYTIYLNSNILNLRFVRFINDAFVISTRDSREYQLLNDIIRKSHFLYKIEDSILKIWNRRYDYCYLSRSHEFNIRLIGFSASLYDRFTSPQSYLMKRNISL